MTDWLSFFEQTIERIRDPLSTVLLASGCREGWLQAEFFRAGRSLNLRVNEYPLGKRMTADLSHGRPIDMLAELKIVGSDHQPKMRGRIERDASRLKAVSLPETECFMILVIPRSQRKGILNSYLHSCSFSDRCFEREWPEFKLRIWTR